MKVILALVAFCVLGCTLAAGQNPPPPSSGPVGPTGPAGPPPKSVPPQGGKHKKASPRNGDLIAALPAKPASIANFDRWFAFESTGGGYTVKFPAKPVSNPGAPVPGTPGLLRYITTLSPGAGRFFQIYYYDFQGHLNSPEIATVAGMNDLVKFAEGRGLKLETRQIRKQGQCQIEESILSGQLSGGFPSPSVMKVRTLFSGDKVYLLLAQTLDFADDLKAIDYFLDSFAVTGGCVDAIKSTTAKITKGNDEGTLDPATGWQQFGASQGISFLLPTRATTEQFEDTALGRTVSRSTYLSVVNGVAFSVEIVNAIFVRDPKDSTRADEMLELTTVQLRTNLAKNNVVLGPCIPHSAGAVLGRECPVTHLALARRGRAQIFVTPKWTFVLTALRETETTDQTTEDRFFNSVRIDAK